MNNNDREYPYLHDHSDDYDYKRDVVTAAERIRSITVDARNLLLGMQENIEFNINQLIAELERSNRENKNDQIEELQQQLAKFNAFSAETIKAFNDRVSRAAADLARIPDLDGIDHICRINVSVGCDYTNRLIELYKKLAQF